jgi:sugar phosphate isomerase/epimerase
MKEERKDPYLKVKKAGLKVCALVAHSSFICSDPEERIANLKYLHGCIELAKDFKTPVVHFISGSCPNIININDAWNLLEDGLSDLIEHCKITGCLPGFESVVNKLIATSNDLTKLIANFNNQLGIVYNPTHFHLRGCIITNYI